MTSKPRRGKRPSTGDSQPGAFLKLRSVIEEASLGEGLKILSQPDGVRAMARGEGGFRFFRFEPSSAKFERLEGFPVIHEDVRPVEIEAEVEIDG